MPIYEFKCEKGHVFEEMRAMISKDRPIPCPECGETAMRIFALPAPGVVKGGTPKHH